MGWLDTSSGRMDRAANNVYPLTSLRIGDVKSHLSQAYLYLALGSHKFLILVDNESWKNSKDPTSAYIREMLTHKYMASPFRNTKTLLRSSSCLDDATTHKWKKIPLISLEGLQNTLHGFLVFEVQWNNVYGINYTNALQTDTSIELEVKLIREWEFNSIQQALSCMSVWFSGTKLEENALQRHLQLASSDALSYHREISLKSADLLLDQQGSKITQDEFFVRCTEIEWEEEDHDHHDDFLINPMDYIKPAHVENTLLTFHFNDRCLPSRLKEIITSDLRLLKLLESGLPSWAIFLQSYPIFCKLYRSWMRPAVWSLYVLVSLITVIIGFYDLYKNVPVLKAMVSHICGSFNEWIEWWDVLLRIRYIRTIFVLENLEMGLRWSLQVLSMVVLLLTRPILELLRAVADVVLSNIWFEAASQVGNIISSVLMPLFSFFRNVFQFFLSPFELLFSCVTTTASLVQLLASCTLEMLLFPAQACYLIGGCTAMVLSVFFELVGRIVMMINRLLSELSHLAIPAKCSRCVSTSSSVRKDIISKVLHAFRSIIKGGTALLSSYKRHRRRLEDIPVL